MKPTSYIIEGLDRLGKSTLIEGLLHEDGFRQVIHYSKPKKLTYYEDMVKALEEESNYTSDYMYQHDSFIAMFEMLGSNAPLILDRAHLGEAVYAPLYRGYDGNYVFELEQEHDVAEFGHVRMILLTEDFATSKHFVDDGESLGDESARKKEQDMFINAFNISAFPDKKIICVTDPTTGKFRSKEDILREATE